MEYYYLDASNEAQGPVSKDELSNLTSVGVLNESSLVAKVGDSEWVALSTVIDVSSLVKPANAAASQPKYAPSASSSPSRQPQTSKIDEPLALWALILSIVGSLCCCLAGIAGIVLALTSLNRINQNPELYKNKGIAKAALIIGYLGFAFNFLVYILQFVIGIVDAGSSY